MEFDSDMNSIILFVSVFIIFFIIGSFYFSIFDNTQVDLPSKKPLIAGENDVCVSPALFIQCQEGLACSTLRGKIITKFDDKTKYLGYCFTYKKITKLKKENS